MDSFWNSQDRTTPIEDVQDGVDLLLVFLPLALVVSVSCLYMNVIRLYKLIIYTSLIIYLFYLRRTRN